MAAGLAAGVVAGAFGGMSGPWRGSSGAPPVGSGRTAAPSLALSAGTARPAPFRAARGERAGIAQTVIGPPSALLLRGRADTMMMGPKPVGAAPGTAQVNVLARPKPRLSIEIVHDLVCPWCYLGVRRLMRTLLRRPELSFELIWRPFLLNPDMPRSGMSRADYVIRKFGGEERARRLYASIAEIGRAEGLAFRFDRIRRTPSSVDAHRLVRWAARFQRADELVELLFAAHFTEGLDIGEAGVLAALARSCGLDPADARSFLAGEEEADCVHAENLRAHRLGINGVPCLVMDGRHAIAGAQEPEVIERLLDVASVELAELQGTTGSA